ncbi:MAG: hypothetical protein A3F42_02280 [Gammaproteobacteria bacterium RIFCSPHIGHO2_12_FULL_37_34]|nr:MAG: hypothetical protein A3F42_02280 [Gammaproteobacteria bacterium RIFCSPHIGHO2_12_FULL_37_34]OHB95562.1 MAG: hypothetical protein A2Z57_08490 [Planctomycetes bacterium RIFCSPHIGHO2_12_39_6]
MFLNSLKTRIKGSAAMEFAMIIPTFMILVMGSIEIGWALYIQNALVDASRLGARMAVTQEADSTTIQSRVSSYMDNMVNSVEGINVTTVPEPATVERGTPITVTVTLPYDSRVAILPAPMILSDINLQAQTTMDKEI